MARAARLPNGLTAQQEQFCVNYMANGGNATQAYRDAYPATTTWQEHSINKCASKSLKNPYVIRRLNGHAKRTFKKFDVSVDRVLQEETCLAYSDIAAIIDENWVIIPPKDLPEDVRRSISAIDIVQKAIGSNGDREILETTFRYKFWDKGRALERLGKHLGVYEADNKQKNEMQAKLLSELFAGVPQIIQLLHDRLTAPSVGQKLIEDDRG